MLSGAATRHLERSTDPSARRLAEKYLEDLKSRLEVSEHSFDIVEDGVEGCTHGKPATDDSSVGEFI